VKSKVCRAVVVPLLEPVQAVVHTPPPVEVWISKLALRVLPLNRATLT
jgi:hypothetical protein